MKSSSASQEPTKYASEPGVQDLGSGPQVFHLRVLIKNRPGVYSQHVLQCSTDDTATEIFDTLRRLHREHGGVEWHYINSVARLFFMQRISIGTARIFEVNLIQHKIQ